MTLSFGGHSVETNKLLESNADRWRKGCREAEKIEFVLEEGKRTFFGEATNVLKL